MPLNRVPWADGMRPVIIVERFGMQIGFDDVRLGEHRPARRERVEVRRLHDGVAAEAGVVGPMLIGDDQQYVRPTHAVVLSALLQAPPRRGSSEERSRP